MDFATPIWPILLRNVCIGLLVATSGWSQQGIASPDIPEGFKLDFETAARLRPDLEAQSIAASGRYVTGRLVFERLVAQVPALSFKPAWQLRIVEDDALNAYASPDGTVYVESELARLAGPSTGLWAAILSHEIAHVMRRDWARRYLLQKSLEGGSAAIVLGDPGQPSASWSNAESASAELARFCRQLEIEADRAGLVLMARAGYHPDFMPALHHLLHAQSSSRPTKSLYAMHPCWEERDRELSRAYTEAAIEFEHRWRDWYASPGGNPPVVVFADQPLIKKLRSQEWELQVPMRCQNLAGAVEVVVRAGQARKSVQHRETTSLGEIQNLVVGEAESQNQISQLTGCTSPRTTVTFTLGSSKPTLEYTDVYVLDAWGTVLARADIPRRQR